MTIAELIEQDIAIQEKQIKVNRKFFEYHRSISALNHLPQEPRPSCSISAWEVNNKIDGNIYLHYHCNSSEEAEEVRSKIQAATGSVAKRQFDKYDGTILYRFSPSVFHITITNGRTAPGCEIIPEQVTVTRFKMVCPDNKVGV